MLIEDLRPQSLEIRDVRNNLVGTGSHQDPQEIVEVSSPASRPRLRVLYVDTLCVGQYYIYQRDMWRPEDDWKVVKRGAKETDTLADPSAQP